MRPSRDTIPVNLICDGRPALVVGYGAVGRRKERMLLSCGASVKVIAPDADEVSDESGRVEHVRRAFRAGDCRNAMIVFACTDDTHVNRAVLEDARSQGVPCCCADRNWADGDFTTPAVVRSGGATVAVSTNGASCASAKALRRSIDEFLKGREAGKVVIAGTADGYIPSERRAAFHMSPDARREMARFIYGMKGVESVVALNTCSRMEVAIYGSVDVGIVKRLMQFHRLKSGEYFILEGWDAFRHAVLVTSGLKSAWAGEFHIVSQVREAIDESMSLGLLNGRLKGFMDDALRTARKVRHAVEGMLEVKEIETTAVEYLGTRLDLSASRIAVLGSGTVGSAVARLLEGRNVKVVHHGEAIPPCDALICALSSREPVVLAPPDGCGVTLDLGMPPNCAPSVGAVSLDDLKNWRRAETGALDAAMAEAERVIESEVESIRADGGRW